MNLNKSSKKQKFLPIIWAERGFSVVTFLVIAILLGVFIGRWMDRTLDVAPWGLFLGASLGLGLGFTKIIKMLLFWTKEDSKND